MTPARPVPKVRALDCPNCGAAVELRGHAHTLNAVCGNCLSVLDTTSPSLKILQQFQAKDRIAPTIRLGQRGKLWGSEYEVIGFQLRQIDVEGVAYRWSEYLLYNPYRGYLYLTEYDGHWNAIRTLRALPMMAWRGKRKAATFGGRTYKHFQTAQAETMYVMGEFPWQVRVGESIGVEDYVSPPYVLSAELTPDEVVWSSGTYMRGAEIWKAFGLAGRAPTAKGVYANQPSPYTARVASAWTTFVLLAFAWLLLFVCLLIVNRGHDVFRQRYAFSTASPGEHAFVTPEFELTGRTSNVEVEMNTDLNNDWAGFDLALVNENTGVAYNLSKQVSYYAGRDSDGSWTEGSQNDRVTFPAVPPGRYYLRVEPDMDDDGRVHSMNYELAVTYGSIGVWWMLIALFLMPIPAIYTTIRSVSFENTRWAESDYGPMFSSSSSED